MSRDKNKPPRRNPFLDDDRDTLLDELGSVRKLLDEDGKASSPPERPGPHDDIPVLLPDDQPAGAGEGDAHTQASLFEEPGADKAGSEQESDEARRRRLLAASRHNPFLPSKSMQDLADERERLTQVTHTEAATASPPASPATDKTPNEAEVRALVDELLAEWLPKIERELRDRLTRRLKGETD